MAASTEVRRLRATPSDTKHLHLPRGAAGAMDASSAFESAPTDPTMAVANLAGRSCRSARRRGPRSRPKTWPFPVGSRSKDSPPAPGSNHNASHRSEAKRPLQFLKGCGFSCCRRVPQHQAREGLGKCENSQASRFGAEVSGVVVPPLKHIFPETQKHGIAYKKQASCLNPSPKHSPQQHPSCFCAILFDTFALIEELLQCITNKVKTC